MLPTYSASKSILNTWRVLLYSCVWQVEVATAYCGWVHSGIPFTWRLLSHNYVKLKLKIDQFSRPPPPLSIYVQNSSTLLTSIKGTHNLRMTIICYQHLLLGQLSFSLVLILLSTCFICKTWTSRQTMEQRNQDKNKTKSRHIQIDHPLHYSI